METRRRVFGEGPKDEGGLRRGILGCEEVDELFSLGVERSGA